MILENFDYEKWKDILSDNKGEMNEDIHAQQFYTKEELKKLVHQDIDNMINQSGNEQNNICE